MAGTGLIHCVLIQALLITVYGNSSKTQFEIICPSVTVTVGEPLHLTCDVPCDECKVKKFSWTKEQDPDLNCADEPTNNDKSLTFHCIIQSASEKHNGEFKFWVQLGNGNSHTLFNVRLELAPTANPSKSQVISVPPSTPDGVPDPGKHKRDKENNRSYGGIVAMVVMLCCLAIIMGALILRNKKNKSMSSSALDIMI